MRGRIALRYDLSFFCTIAIYTKLIINRKSTFNLEYETIQYLASKNNWKIAIKKVLLSV